MVKWSEMNDAEKVHKEVRRMAMRIADYERIRLLHGVTLDDSQDS